MATFYIQLKDRLLQISGELTAENISKALGYVPVDSSTLNNYATKEEVSSLVDMSMVEELSQRVDNISFDNLKDNPFLLDESGELNIVDEQGNVIAKVDSNGIHSIDFIAEEHRLTDKIDATALNGLAKETWVTEYVTKTVTEGKVDLTGYATEEYVDNKDFYDIKNNPIINGEEGNLIFVDESGNIGLKLDKDNNLTVKDVIAGDHILSNKVDKETGKGLSTEDFTTALKTKLQSLSNYDDTTITNAINTLREDFDTLVSGDTTTAINTFNEIIAFLNGVEDTESLEGIIASIEQQIANIEIPSLDGYATESWVNDKNYLQHQDISHLATKTEVSNSINDIEFFSIKNNPIADTEDGNLIFVDETGNIGLKLDKDNNLTVADVVAGEHVLSNKADKSDLEGLATEQYVITKVAEAKLEGSDIVIPVQDVKVNGQTVIKDMVAEIDLTPYAKTEDIPSLDGYVQSSELPNFDEFAKSSDIPSIEGLATEQWVTDKNYLTEHQDISHLASTDYVDEQIANVDVTEQLKDYALKSELPVNVSDLNNDEGYLTQHQDISHLATKEELDTKDFYEIHNNPIVNDGDGKLVFVDESGNIGLQLEADNTLYVKDVVAGDDVLSNKADKSEIPSLDGYATESYVDTKFNSIEVPSLDGYAKEEDLPNFNEFAKTTDIPSLDGYVQSSQLPDFNEFIKSDDIPSLEGLATEDFVTSQGYLTEIPSEYITNTELNSKGYATKTELNSLDFDNINNTPFTNDKNGELNIVDEQGNIGMKLDGECLYVKDVVAGEHILSEKVDKTYVDEAVAGIVDGAPETLDTLNELAAALNDNADIVDVLNQSISSKQDVIADLETIRQGAAKGATALQSYTEQYKGTVTSIKIDGISKTPSSGEVDLGYINKKLTTSTSSSMTLSPNVYYRNTNTSLSSLTITLGSVSNSNIINEYFVEFTTSSSGTTVSLPSTIKWVDGVIPTWEAGYTYQLSIVNNLGVCVKFK